MLKLALITAMLAVTPLALASDPVPRSSHFEPIPSETLTEAVRNFSEYNGKLEEILAGPVDDGAIADIHQITYTLENALGKINAELAALAEKLEELHIASEKLDRDKVILHGSDYLDVSKQVIE